MIGAIREPNDHRTSFRAPSPLDAFNRSGLLDPIDVRSAVAVAALYGETDPEVLLAAAMTVRGTRLGHVCIEPATVREAVVVDGVAPETVDALDWPDPDTWLDRVRSSPMVTASPHQRAMVVDGERLYLARYWETEIGVAADLLGRTAVHPTDPGPISALLHQLFSEEADLQRLAAAMAITNRLSVISGGPGTGKTFTIARIIGMLVSMGESERHIAVAAPTGKAAARLTDQIRAFADSGELEAPVVERVRAIEASTIHRLLGWRHGRGRFVHHSTNPLAFDTVIIDEMSMVSLPMMAKLLDAIPHTTRVVLVGDPDQLVSIEAGSVLGDLVGPARTLPRYDATARERLSDVTGDEVPQPTSGPTGGLGNHVITLDRGFRFDANSPLGELADAIRVGDADRALGLFGEAPQLTWIDPGDRQIEDISEVTGRMVTHARRLIELAESGSAERALDELSNLAVLCAHRRGMVGVEYWARWIERNSRLSSSWSDRWYPGLPVMVTANEYRLGVFNGDLGVVVDRGGRLEVAFADAEGVRMIGPAQLPSTVGAHAVTIHKSQGSQFERVTVIAPGPDSRLLSRELLYTAVTRATLEVTVVGSEDSIRAAIARQVVRSSGLDDRLWSAR